MLRLLFVLLSLSAGPLLAAGPSTFMEPSDRSLLLRACSHCHAVSSYTPSDRTAKDWELTVDRMRSYAQNSESQFSDSEAARIVQVLAHYPENKPLSDWLDQEPPATPVPEAAVATVPPAPAHPVPALATSSKPHWILRTSRVLGDVALALLAAMVFSGLLRKPLGRHFRPVHAGTAILLAVTALVHSIVFVAKHGLPNILWFWFGLVAMLVILGAIAGGYLRRQWKGTWFRFHKAAAIVGLLLVLLHWVWFYLK